MKLMCAVLCALALVGCATSETVTLRNQAGMTVQCGPYTAVGNLSIAAINSQNQLRDCVADFQRQGYERIGG